jgi:gas vesicle protein
MAGLQTIVTDTNDQMVVELRALTNEMSESTQQVTDLVKGASQAQLKSINLEIKKQISGVGNKTSEEISSLKSKIKNTDSDTLRKLSLNQAAILSTLQAVSSQNDDIKKRFEEQQDKISFP